MEPVFTLAGISDIEILVEMMKEFYASEQLRFEEQAASLGLKHILSNRNVGTVHLINIGQKVIGYIVITFGYSLEFHGHIRIIDELYLKEDYRRKGIGKATLQFIEGICRKEGIKAVRLEVERVNFTAQSLYQHEGYQEHDRYLMTKWLEED